MQRVSAILPSWDRPKSISAAPATSGTQPTAATTTSKRPTALGKVLGWKPKIGASSNRHSTTSPTTPARFGPEHYWPAPLDKECDKAARILKSFCTDGFLAEEAEIAQPAEAGATSAVVCKKIPPRIIQNAVGIAMFSCMRSGLWVTGSGGSGLITARKADGTWSPPSGIILHTADLGFVIGVDIYDCILVINSIHTLEMFTRATLTLGSDVPLSLGPLVKANAQDQDTRWTGLDDTVLTYVKARGKHRAVSLHGSVVSERVNENVRFYGGDVGVLDILAGNIPKEIPEMRPLFEVIKAAEGRVDYDTELLAALAQQPAPGDAIIEMPKVSPASPTTKSFGIPSADDPDPFGVIGLEMAGIEIREAGTNLRPSSAFFEFHPSPTSPVYSRFSRQSIDTHLSNRGSYMSAKTQATAMTDAFTQTDVGSTKSDDGREPTSEKLSTVMEPDEVDYTKIDTSIIQRFTREAAEETEEAAANPGSGSNNASVQTGEAERVDSTTNMSAADERDEDADDEEEDEDEEEPVICEVATAARTSIQTTQLAQVIHAKGALVNIPKRVPPPLPMRSPARISRASKSEYGDVSSLKSPLRNSFVSADSQTVSDDGTADTSACEAFTTPLTGNPPTMTKSPLGVEIPDTAGAAHTTPEEPGSAEISPQIPPTPQGTEAPSSAEESDREPRTPQTENIFVASQDKESGELTLDGKEVSILSPHGTQQNSAVAVA